MECDKRSNTIQFTKECNNGFDHCDTVSMTFPVIASNYHAKGRLYVIETSQPLL